MKILVVKLSSLGDIIHLFPAISDLHRHLPDAKIHWLVEPAFAEVVGWHSAIDKIITVPVRAYKKTWWKIPVLLSKLRKQLRAENYDVVLDAQGLLKSALLARLAGNTVFGFSADSAREPLAARFYQKVAKIPDRLHVIEKNRQLVSSVFAVDISQDIDYGLNEIRQMWLQADISYTLKDITDQPYIVLLHGTTWNSKYWPETSWTELIHLLVRQGWCCLLPWGNEVERQRALRLKAAGGKNVQVLPKLSLTELMKVLLHARAFISVETGIGHLAAVLDILGIMLHGPTSPSYSGILGKNCHHVTSGLTCSPCFKRNCPILNEAGLPPCQQVITAQAIFRQYQALLTYNGKDVGGSN